MRMSFHDLETFSPVPIRHGAWAYAEEAEVLLWAYALEDGPIKVWDVASGAPMPNDLAALMADDNVATCWHNGGMFDSTVLKLAMGIDIPLRRMHDTLVQALAHSLPGSLGDLCDILKIDTDKSKDKAGKDLIRLFCVPPAKNIKRGRATAATHPAEWAKFVDYASLDIAAMREIYRKMPRWNLTPTEVNMWHVDQIINRRGMCVDVELAECAVNAVAEAQEALRAKTHAMTNGEVDSATRRDAMLQHVLAEYGVALPDMQMATIERRIADPDLPEGLRELLKVRLQASTTSTSKYTALLNCVSSDGRLRGTKQFCGAGRTGRWAGRLFQPDNLPRPTLKQDEIDAGIEALKGGLAGILYDNVMQLTSSAIRGCVVAPAGKKLVVADLSNIEGRVLAWLAGERWKIKAFGEYDKGTGHDLYKLSYGKSFSVAPEAVTKDQRQVGKVQELALGYEGGVGAFVTFAAAYNIDLEHLAEIGSRAIPGEVWGRANIMYEWHQKQGRHPDAALGLSKKAWLTCESFKIGWRDAHPNVVQLWRDLDAAVRAAITTPGETIIVGVLKVRRDGAWLRIVLPSGRALCYPSPALVPEKKSRKISEWNAEDADENALVEDVTGRTVITYMGVNQYTRKWDRLTTYGGKLVENVTQAVARDVMAANMPTVEAEMYEIVLSVHDELITEAPDHDDWNAEHLASIMATVPPWAAGLPLAAAGFEAYRYRKD